jgi:uncharacterized protein YegL
MAVKYQSLGWIIGRLFAPLAMSALVLLSIFSQQSLRAQDRPENILVIVLDDSGSMKEKMVNGQKRESRMAVAKQALNSVVNQLDAKTQLGVLLLNGAKREKGWLVPLGQLDKSETLMRIGSIQADGGTPLGSSLKRATDSLMELRQRFPFSQFRLLVVTDGEATDPKLLKQHLPYIVSRGISVDVIGVDMAKDHSLATRTHSYRRANDAEALQKALKEVLAESASDSDVGESAFAILDGLPDELAKESLIALQSVARSSTDHEASPSYASENSVASTATSPAATASSSTTSAGNSSGHSQAPKVQPGKNSVSPYWLLGIIILWLLLRGKSKFSPRNR